MNKRSYILTLCILAVGLACWLEPSLAFADFESSLENIQDKLIHTFLPVFAIIGLALAGISFASGNPSAKQHIIYAVIGCVIGFGAEGLVTLIQSLVN